ncbi:MAG: hypothetical protein LBK61_03235 [Spirochaetaceae bacterium]|nr:hypothetical protein [Spirochaetaceae bacterium]
MDLFPAQRLRFIFAAYLALSVLGVFIFAAAPDVTVLDFWKSKPVTDGAVSSMDADYAVDCLVQYSAKTRGHTTLSSRKSAHSITFFGTLCAGIAASLFVTKAAKPAKAPNSKSTLLLKLRI